MELGSLDHLLLVTPLGQLTINNNNNKLSLAVVYGRQRQHFKQMVVNVSINIYLGSKQAIMLLLLLLNKTVSASRTMPGRRKEYKKCLFLSSLPNGKIQFYGSKKKHKTKTF
jgi:hypothetical protein